MLERIKSWSLYVALIGATALLVALGTWMIQGEAALWVELCAAGGALVLALAVILNPAPVRAALTGRQARYGGNAALMSVAFLLILVMLNVLGARHPQRWDTTQEKQFSLSEQTRQVLRGLREPVQVKLFFTPSHYSRQSVEDLLKEYVAHSDKISYEFIDPDAQRRQALDYQISRDGTIVFQLGTRREVVFGYQEQDLTSGLVKITSNKVRGVYFLTGHQEVDPDATDQTGYSLIKQALISENYQVNTFNMAVTSTWPSDLSVLVVAGPKQPLTAAELTRLAAFINNGGKALLMVEAGMADPLGGMLHAFGLDLADDLVLDTVKSFYGDIASPLVDRYEYHQITKDLTGLTSFFPTARSVVKANPAPAEWNVHYLALSSASSWAETGYRDQRVKADANEAKGPLGLAAAVEPSAAGTGKGRMVVIGDAHLVDNGTLSTVGGSVGNLDLVMNAVGWLAEEESLISIRPKQPEQRQVILTAPQSRAIIYGSIILMPLLVLAVGVLVWWRRR
jgi:ABC-type uncharacterized transport system involved in gliding motility auxiliary subunit